MAQTTQERQKKKTKKIRHISTDIDFEARSPILKAIVFAVIAVLALTVAGNQVYVRLKTQKELPTETALISTVYSNITVQAIALRSETVLTNNSTGTVVPMVENGSKVAINDTVATVYSSVSDAENATRLKELNENAEYYEDMQNLTSGNLVAGLELYSNNVVSELLEFEKCINSGNLSGVSETVAELGESITKKQIATGGSVDVSEKLQSIYSEIDNIKNSSSAVAVTAPVAGYYVNTVDGYESACDMSGVLTMTTADVNNLLNTAAVVPSSNVGKLITQFNWYLVCNVSEEDADKLDKGSKFNISVDELGGDVIRMTLKAKNISEDGVTLVFSSNIMDSELATLRCSQVKIRVEEFTGLTVNKKAIRTVDGNIGVYVQVGNQVKFRQINIIYPDESTCLAEITNDDDYLKLYDKVIIEGVDYDDGQIIT